MIGGDRTADEVVVVLILERDPAALSVVKTRDALVHHRRTEHIVVERINRAVLIVLRAHSRRVVDRLVESSPVVEGGELRNITCLAPADC